MKNVSHNKGWVMDTNMSHIYPPPIPLIKETSISKSDGDRVKLNLRRYPTSITLHIYGFRMYLFDHSETEEFILFIKIFQMTLASSGTLETESKVQFIRTLVCGEALCQFDLVSSDAKNTGTQLYVDYLLKGLE